MCQAPTNSAVAAVLCASLSISACTTSVTHRKLEPTDVQTEPGFSYYLPRQKYTVAITYELTDCVDSDNFDVAQSATIVEESEADLSEYYLLTYESVNSSLKTTIFTASTYPNQTLKSVGVTIDDRSAAVVKSVTSTAISVAKMALGMPAGFVAAGCNQKTHDALKVVEAAEITIMDPTADSNKRKAAAEAIAHAKNQLRIVHVERMVPTWPSTPSAKQVVLSADQLAKWFDPNVPVGDPQDDAQRKVTTEIVVAPKIRQAPGPQIAAAGEGVVYRDPMPAAVRVCRQSCSSGPDILLTELNTQIAQLGRYMAVTLTNRGFDKNNVTLNFTANGALENMIFGTESSLERFTASLSDTATQVQGFADVRRRQLEAEEAAERAAPLNAIEAETALLKAKADRIEAENRLRALGGDPSN